MKKGFTLVELIAIITILGVMAILVLPRIVGSNDDKKQKQYENIISIIENAAKVYHSTHEEESVVFLSTLISEDYVSSNLMNPITNELINGCVEISTDIDGFNVYTYLNSCSTIEVNLEVRLNDGSTTQSFRNKYMSGTTITLVTPTRSGYLFLGWTVEGAGSSISGNVLNIGTGDTILIANWRTHPLLSAHITNLSNTQASSNGLFRDPTADTNIRYTGLSPKNYVLYNNELWRIIGVFNVSNGTTTSNRVKLIREASIGYYSWDSSETAVNTGYGVNNWVASDLNLLLNDYYYNGKNNQKCYNGQNNAQVDCGFSSVVLDSTSKNLIENAVWNLGGNGYNPSTPPYGLPTATQYAAERGTTVYTAGTPTTHTAKIGLLFPSDYGYASTDIDCRTDLIAGTKYENSIWDYSVAKCKNNNWLHIGYNYWTISPSSGYSYVSFLVYGDGLVYDYLASHAFGVHPVVYLKSDVKIVRGTGSEGNPYELSL